VSVWEKHPKAKQIIDDRTFGQRAADRMRNTMGSWPFVFAFFGVMITWAFVNTILKIGNPPSTSSNKGFDPYPYILLNLFLSMLAGIQAAALLIAAKRSDHVASIIAVDTDDNTKQIKASLDQNTELTRLTHTNTQLIHLLAHKAGITDAEMAAALKSTHEPGDPQ
jgi:uncharacterized membrane protein